MSLGTSHISHRSTLINMWNLRRHVPIKLYIMLKVCCILVLLLLDLLCVYANTEGDALYAFRLGLDDPDTALDNWDHTLVNPCTWFHVTCNSENKVERLDLGNTNLRGPLSAKLGVLTSLQYLELNHNKLNGSIPKELGNLASLVSMDLYRNNLTGSIPKQLGNLKVLRFLRLNDNQLSGPVPAVLAKLRSIRVMDLSNNPCLCGWKTNRTC